MSPFFAEHRLPRGRHGIPREQVEANQRWRLLGACADVLRERGYACTTVALVTKEAAVSKGTFYRHFDGLASCIRETYRVAAKSFLESLSESCEPLSGAPLADLMQVVLEFLEAETAMTYVLTDPALDDVPGLLDVRAELTEHCASLLGQIRPDPVRYREEQSRRRQLVRGAQGLLAGRLSGGGRRPRSQELAQMLSL